MINPKFHRFLAVMLAAVLFLLDVPMVHAEPETSGIHESLPLTGLTEGATDTPGEASERSDETSTEGSDEPEDERPRRPVIVGYDMELGYPPVDNYSVDGTAAILYDLNSDTVIFTQNPNDKVYPASLTKLITAMIIAENAELTDTVTITANAVHSVEARTGDVMIGEQMTVNDLLHCILVASSNECAVAGAEHVSGSADDFVVLMNQKAAELGCTGTHFANPHGLHDDDHYTTANDLLRIAKAALENDLLREICYSTRYEMPETNMQEARTVYTTNYMTSEDLSTKYYYKYAKGVKTGYTGKAGRCLIVTAEYGDMNLLAVLTGCRTEDVGHGELVMHSFFEAKNLFKYGFNNYEYAIVLSPMVPVAEIPVTNGASSTVVVAPVDTCSIVLPVGYDPNDIRTEVTVNGGAAQAPFSKGDVIGTATVYYQNKEIRHTDVTPIVDMATADAVQQTETITSIPETPKDIEGKRKLSFWSVALILLALFLLFYLASYVYNNMTRGKPTPQHKKHRNKRHMQRPTRRSSSPDTFRRDSSAPNRRQPSTHRKKR